MLISSNQNMNSTTDIIVIYIINYVSTSSVFASANLA